MPAAAIELWVVLSEAKARELGKKDLVGLKATVMSPYREPANGKLVATSLWVSGARVGVTVDITDLTTNIQERDLAG